MKNVLKEEVRVEKVSYVEFHLPLIDEYWNPSRFVELFTLDASLRVNRDETTGNNVYHVRMQTDSLDSSGLSYDEIIDNIAYIFNICCDEHNKAENEKEIARKNELDSFIKNGVKNQNLLDNDYSKKIPLEELQEYAKDLLNDAEKSNDEGLKLTWYSDSEDVLKILYHLEKWETVEAKNAAHYLDTAVREGIPDSVWSLVNDY